MFREKTSIYFGLMFIESAHFSNVKRVASASISLIRSMLFHRGADEGCQQFLTTTNDENVRFEPHFVLISTVRLVDFDVSSSVEKKKK